MFRNILDRISNGETTQEDWQTLMNRRIELFGNDERNAFENAVRIYSTNKETSEYNCRKLKDLHVPVAQIKAIHTPDGCDSVCRNLPAELASGLEPFLNIALNCRVMLRQNLWTAKGLVNGALGFVRDIVYTPGTKPPQQPIVIMVEFDAYSGPTIEGNLVPITSIMRTIKHRSNIYNRKQFPIQLASAMTIHKSQGLTLDKAVVNIGKKEMSLGMSYVALSRVRTLEGLAIEKHFDFQRLDSIKRSAMLKDRQDAVARMIRRSNI